MVITGDDLIYGIQLSFSDAIDYIVKYIEIFYNELHQDICNYLEQNNRPSEKFDYFENILKK